MVPESPAGTAGSGAPGAGGAAGPQGRRRDGKEGRLEGTEAQGDEEGEKLDAREAGLAKGQVALASEQRSGAPGACGPRNVREGQFPSPTRRGALLSSARLGVIFGPAAIRQCPPGTCVCRDIAGSETY